MQVVIFSSPQRKDMLSSLIDELIQIIPVCQIKIIDDPKTFGKQNFWKRWEQARKICIKSKFDNYLIIPDDICNIDLKTIKKTFSVFKNKPFVCSIISDDRRSCWSSIPKKTNNFMMDGYKFEDLGFFDCGGLTNRKTLQKIKVDPVPKSWFIRPNMSSGVGQQLTSKLKALKVPMFVTTPSLSFHGDHDSSMHLEARKLKPLIAKTKNMDIPIYVGMATFGNRPVDRALKSISHQVDKIFLYDNEEQPDIADNGKFYVFEKTDKPCYVFLCDDDLEYSDDYIEKTILAIERHKCIITHHGRILTKKNVPYYTGHKSFRCLDDQKQTVQLDVAGTGVTAFRSDYFCPKGLYLSGDKKMSDLVFSLEAAKQGKKIMTVPHLKGFVKQLPINNATSIHSTMRNNQKRLIEIANEIIELK